MMKNTVKWTALTVALLIALPAVADQGVFQVEFDPNGTPRWLPDVNDGVQNSWFPYPQPDQGFTWWNEWWPNVYDPLGYKLIVVGFDVIPMDGAAPAATAIAPMWDLVINWTTIDYQRPDIPTPGDPPDFPSPDEPFIVRSGDPNAPRLEPFDCPNMDYQYEYAIWLDYCPAWVSVDVRGYGVEIYGELYHECFEVPEPASMALLGLGLAALALRRKMR